MIEMRLRNYLSTALGVPCYLELPLEVPASYVVIERTGSRNKNHIDTGIFAIQSIAESMYKAALLNESIKAAMTAFGESSGTLKVSLETDYNFTNLKTKEYRHQAVYEITYY